MYDVSDDGRVWSRWEGGRVLKSRGEPGRYPMVGLSLNGRYVNRRIHSLVTEAFLGPRPAGMEVRHLDGNALNSNLTNLAYGTRSENHRDTVAHGKHAKAARTHCAQGHPYDAENTLRPSHNPRRRICRACRKVWSHQQDIKRSQRRRDAAARSQVAR